MANPNDWTGTGVATEVTDMSIDNRAKLNSGYTMCTSLMSAMRLGNLGEGRKGMPTFSDQNNGYHRTPCHISAGPFTFDFNGNKNTPLPSPDFPSFHYSPFWCIGCSRTDSGNGNCQGECNSLNPEINKYVGGNPNEPGDLLSPCSGMDESGKGTIVCEEYDTAQTGVCNPVCNKRTGGDLSAYSCCHNSADTTPYQAFGGTPTLYQPSYTENKWKNCNGPAFTGSDGDWANMCVTYVNAAYKHPAWKDGGFGFQCKEMGKDQCVEAINANGRSTYPCRWVQAGQ